MQSWLLGRGHDAYRLPREYLDYHVGPWIGVKDPPLRFARSFLELKQLGNREILSAFHPGSGRSNGKVLTDRL